MGLYVTSHTEYALNNVSGKCVFNSHTCYLTIICCANENQTFKMEIQYLKMFEILSGRRSPAEETKQRSNTR